MARKPQIDELAGTQEVPAADQVAAQTEPGPGAAIGHFVVRERLGEGGMGVVLACVDPDLGRPVAIKLVRDGVDHPAYRARLLREAQAMARLEHPNVVKIYEVGNDRGKLFIAMELVDGTTLSAWLREPRPWRDILDMFLQVGEGLAAVHGEGLVHRDFKPDNVLVDRGGRARVADFGIAHVGGAHTLTNTGAMMGTPGYMAPEQQFGTEVDPRADQYSYCVALREALGGRPLDDARWARLPKPLRNAVMRGLSYEASDRFASMNELLAALRAITVPASEPRWIVALLVLVVIGTVAGIVAYVTSSRHDKQPAQVAIVHDAMPAVRDEPDAAHDDKAVLEAPPPPAVVEHAPGRVVTPAKHTGVGVTPDAAVAAAAAVIAGPAAVTVDAAVALPTEQPGTAHKPEAQVGHPGHLPVVKKAIKELGYDGFDASEQVDAATPIGKVKLGQRKRRAGDCAGASALWEQAIADFKHDPADDAQTWQARAWMGRALCALAAGKADDALELVTHVWQHGNHDEVSLVMAFATYDKGDKNAAYGLLLTAQRLSNAKVHAALETWLDGMGLTLR